MTDKKIVPYSEFTNQMEALREKADFLPDMTTDEGYQASKDIHKAFRKVENGIEDERKAQKKYWLDGGKAVDKEGKGISCKVADLREPHTEAYQKVDSEKKEREAKRITGLEERLAYIRDLPFNLGHSSSPVIKLAMEAMQAEECLKFYEFTAAALEARNATRTSLGELYIVKVKQEKDAAELKEFKAKQAEQVIADKVNERVAEALEAQAAPVQQVGPASTPSMDGYRDHQREVNTGIARGIVDESGVDMATAKVIVRAIARKQISNITINY